MCGIFGYAKQSNAQTDQQMETINVVLKNLARESEVRGTDSTGIAVINENKNPQVFNPNNSGTDVICVGTDPDTNRAATNMVAWAWTSVSGYSSFDRYSGNGDASGPFIYTGFAPAAVCVKSQEVGRNWIWETKVQNQSNPANTFLSTNLEEAEATNNNQAIDFLSNGFKIRSSDNDVNQDGELYIYCAWAQSPFGGNNVSPANAQ